MRTRDMAVYDQWKRLSFDPDRLRNPSRAAQVEAEWQSMWARYIDGPNLERTHVYDAGLVALLGWGLAAQRRDFVAGLARVNRWFEHPDAGASEDKDEFRALRAAAHLLLGREPEAVEEYYSLLEDTRRTNLYIVRNHLFTFAGEQPSDSVASPDLTKLAALIISRFRGRRRLARTLESDSVTFGQMVSALDQTYPKNAP
jgi:hypothetical protein